MPPPYSASKKLVSLQSFILVLKYWIRLISLPSSRLVSHCYWSLYDLPNCSDSWLDSMKNIIYSSGQCFIWNNQNEFGASGQFNLRRHQAYLSQNRKDQSFQHLFGKLQSKSKLHLFKNTKETLAFQIIYLKSQTEMLDHVFPN